MVTMEKKRIEKERFNETWDGRKRSELVEW